MIFLVQRSCESKGWKWLFLENIRIDKNIHHNQFSAQGPWLLWDVSVADKGCSVLSANPNENVRVLRVWLDTGYYPELTNKCAGRLLIVWGLVAPPAQPSPAQHSPPCHCSRSECCTGETGSGWSRRTIWTPDIEIEVIEIYINCWKKCFYAVQENAYIDTFNSVFFYIYMH